MGKARWQEILELGWSELLLGHVRLSMVVIDRIVELSGDSVCDDGHPRVTRPEFEHHGGPLRVGGECCATPELWPV